MQKTKTIKRVTTEAYGKERKGKEEKESEKERSNIFAKKSK